ncbi:uncharacterized protein LOC142954829 [Anarhichas minor]|uniref:uncharacterized protein LOC142954829 n=1 Tax=Anarhichas minor TaxID=65739 RepID=UPI003F739D32
MSNVRLQHFRSFLTERFTSVAVDIFGEIETIVEAYYEENKHLRNVLHMVLNPEIKLPRIDVPHYTGAATDVREEPPELNITHYTGAATDVREQPPELNITHYTGAASDVREQPPELNITHYTGAATDVREQPPELNITHYTGAASDVREQPPELNITHYTGAATDVREQPPELSNKVDPEISEPLPKKPKEEQIEHEISLGSEQQQLEPGEVGNFIFREQPPQLNITHYTGAATDVREQPPELSNKVDPELSGPLPKKPKEEQIDHDISLGSEQQQQQLEPGEVGNFIFREQPPELNITHYTGAATDVREQPPELSNKVDPELSGPLPKKPKEEQIDHDISLGSEQQQQQLEPGVVGNFILNVKSDPKEEEEETSMPCIIDSFHVRVVEVNSDSPGILSADEDEDCYADEDEDCYAAASDTSEPRVPDLPQLPSSEESTSRSRELQKRDKKSGTGSTKPRWSLQKTMLELPRMATHQSFLPAPTDCRSFLTRLTEAFKNFPDDKKPLITKMGLTEDVELVDCAFGKGPKGCSLSYRCPVPSERDYRIHINEPPRPLLPLAEHRLKPMPVVPTLSAKEQAHMDVMQITWEAAHLLEQSTRGHKEEEEKLRTLRLTSRFKEVCKLKPGRTNAQHLLFKIQKGLPRCKAAQIEEEMKAEALREYCKHLCVNWSPCGFVIHPNAPWLGALPSGLVYDPKETPSFGLVHVKFTGFRSFIECKFLFYPDGILQLKSTHSHYWQIQGEMMVTGTEWCDLLVFSREDMLVQRIYRDDAMINVMKKKLDDFFYYYYLPCLS